MACSARFLREFERNAKLAGWEPGQAGRGQKKHVVEALTHKHCLDRAQIYRLLKAVELLHDPAIDASITNGNCPHPTLLLAASRAKGPGVAARVIRRALDDGWTEKEIRVEVRRLNAERTPAPPIPGTVRRQDALAFLGSLAPHPVAAAARAAAEARDRAAFLERWSRRDA